MQWRDKDGNLKQTLSTGRGSTTTGMAFDVNGNLYVTNFEDQSVSRFDKSGNLLGTFGGGYNLQPESIVFDQQVMYMLAMQTVNALYGNTMDPVIFLKSTMLRQKTAAVTG